MQGVSPCLDGVCVEFNWMRVCVSVVGEVSVGCVRRVVGALVCGVKCGCVSCVTFQCDMWIM